MAKSKKITGELEGNPDSTIDEESTMQTKPVFVEDPEPALVEPIKPMVNEKPDYIALLNERPLVPVLTNMQEAIHFVEDYQRWNRKVKLALK
jgi:hypothetical protein